MSLKVLHSLMETSLWKQLNLHVHFLEESKMKTFRTFFTRANENGEGSGIDNSHSDNNHPGYPVTTLNTIRDFETLHELKNKGTQTIYRHILYDHNLIIQLRHLHFT